ncbi:MAG: hypothetical protein JO306_00430 [Gemmatimonadetes bacterium]|nr:hypothetical protein [Gemmatimonadota bacterium]
MEKMRLNPDRLKVDTFEPKPGAHNVGLAVEIGAGCSVQPTCGNPSRGEQTYEQEVLTRYACCV